MIPHARFSLAIAVCSLLLFTSACSTTPQVSNRRASVVKKKPSLHAFEIHRELTKLESDFGTEKPSEKPLATPSDVVATKPVEDVSSIGRKISGATPQSSVAVKVQELADGELLITPAAMPAPLRAQNKPAPMPGTKVATLANIPRAGDSHKSEPLKKLRALESSDIELSSSAETPLIFDIPVTYNDRVKVWVRYFQTTGRTTFKNWLERSSRYLPFIQFELQRAGLPQDLVYVAMIESGFVSHAASHAGAKGMWQFITPTAQRYSLNVDWWIDERQDFHKSTFAAIRYMTDLYRQFNSWYLVAASYNMGEGGVRRLIKRHKTNNFWDLAERGALPQETTDYVPKIIAAMLISKAPALYGFRELEYQMPLTFEQVNVPGGTDIVSLATFLGVSEKYLKDLNPELIKGFIPKNVRSHKIRVPKGSMLAVSQYVRKGI